MSDSLRTKSVTAVLWSGTDIFLRQGLAFVVSIVLARLLTPEEFGTVALLLLFTGIAKVFVDSGFSAALIQQQDSSHTDESTVFWFNLFMGTLVSILLWQSAPLIAEFYRLPVLVPLTTVLALNVLINALGSIHGTLLTKRLEFKAQMKVGLIATILSGTLGIFLAWRGFGVWALVVQILTASAVSTLLLWWVNSWRPGLVFSFDSAKRMFGFGGYLFAASLLDVIYTRGYSLLIGKFYGVRELGFYNRADGTQKLPTGVLAGILSRVAFPIFSLVHQDKPKLKAGLRIAIRALMLINIPVMLGLIVVADLLISVLFGDRWLPSAPILKVLCIGGLFWPLHVINLDVLKAQGHSKLLFKIDIIKKILGISLLIVGTFFGVMGIAWSTVIFGGFAFIINAHYTHKYLAYGALQQTLDCLPTMAVGLVMAILLYWIGLWLSWPALPKLLSLSVFGLFLFVAGNMVFRVSAFYDTFEIIRGRSDELFTPTNN